MTPPNLDKSHRRKIKKIARDWTKGRLEGPAQLYNRVGEELTDLWPRHKEEVKAELDRALTLPSSWEHVRKAGLLILYGLILFLFLYVVSVSIAVPLLLHDDLATAVVRRAVLSTPITEPTGVEEMEATASPSPPVSLAPTTPPPQPTEPTPLVPTLTLTPTTEPAPPPLPALVISGVIMGDTEQVSLGEMQLTLSSRREGEQDWAQGETIPPDGDNGAFSFTAQVVDEPRYYRLEINAPLGAYVEDIKSDAEDWKAVTDTISGLITSLESQRTLTKATFSDVQVTLAAVPVISIEEIPGTYITNSFRQPDPHEDKEQRGKGTVLPSVTVLGQWVDNKQWRLSCCQSITETGATDTYGEYFWIQTVGKWGVTVTLEQEAELPTLYLPSEVDLSDSPSGWESKTIDGLTILSSQDVTVTQPVTLEWRIDNVQDWFRLEVWAPRGSQGATYQVIALVDENPIDLKPLDGTLKVAPMPNSEMSAFKSIGTYHLNEEHTIIIRLQTEAAVVRAGFIRLLK